VANLPPPVPRKTSSSSAMIFSLGRFEVDLFCLPSKIWWRIINKAFEFGGDERELYCELS